jgi:hypothetical protein
MHGSVELQWPEASRIYENYSQESIGSKLNGVCHHSKSEDTDSLKGSDISWCRRQKGAESREEKTEKSGFAAPHNKQYQGLLCTISPDNVSRMGGAYAKLRGSHPACRKSTSDDRPDRSRALFFMVGPNTQSSVQKTLRSSKSITVGRRNATHSKTSL